MIKYNVEKRAGDIACSLIAEGYFMQWKYKFSTEPRIVFRMRHRKNGNLIEADVKANITQLWKNGKIIKSEPYPAPGA